MTVNNKPSEILEQIIKISHSSYVADFQLILHDVITIFNDDPVVCMPIIGTFISHIMNEPNSFECEWKMKMMEIYTGLSAHEIIEIRNTP